MKQTKIVASVSDRRCDVDFIRQLFNAGVNVVRMNTAHASAEGIKNIIRNVREVSPHIGILIDTKGPEVLYYGCFIFSGTTLSFTNLVATNSKELARQAGWKLTDESRYKLDTLTLDNSLLPGLAAGLVGVQPEDEGYILFTGKYGYGGSQKGTIPARSALAYYFWIENISNEN